MAYDVDKAEEDFLAGQGQWFTEEELQKVICAKLFMNGWELRYEARDRKCDEPCLEVYAPEFTSPVATRPVSQELYDSAKYMLLDELNLDEPDVRIIEATMKSPTPTLEQPSASEQRKQREQAEAKAEDAESTENLEASEEAEREKTKKERRERLVDVSVFAAGAAIGAAALNMVAQVIKGGMR